jgi:uncharacterized membrane protein YfcA
MFLRMAVWQWALAAVSAVLIGVSKTGVPGLGILPVVMMLWVIPDGRLSGGAVLPLLCLADLFAVRFYRHHARWDQLARLSPYVGAGLVLGVGALRLTSGTEVLDRLMGALLLIMVALQAQRLWRGDPAVPHRWWLAALFGVTAGFATTVANAAGPVMSLYLLSMDLPQTQFLGTTAWFFLVINLVKVPLFLIPDAHGQTRITLETLRLNLWLAPLVIAGALAGRVLVQRINQRVFAWLVLILAAAGTLKLIWR